MTGWFERMVDRLQSGAFIVLAGYLPIVAWGRERDRRTTISQRVDQRDNQGDLYDYPSKEKKRSDSHRRSLTAA